MASQAELAAHLVLDQAAVSRHVKNGVIPSAGRGRYDLDECRKAYILHIRAQASGRQGAGPGLSLEGERARLAKEQADSKAMENAEKRGELIPAAEVGAAWEQIGTEIKRVLLSLPSDVAPLLVGKKTAAEVEAVLMDRVIEGLEALAGTSVDVEEEDIGSR